MDLVLTLPRPALLRPFSRGGHPPGTGERTATRVTAIPLQEELLPFPPTLFALSPYVSSHYLLPLLWEIGVTFFTSSTRIPDALIV